MLLYGHCSMSLCVNVAVWPLFYVVVRECCCMATVLCRCCIGNSQEETKIVEEFDEANGERFHAPKGVTRT
jgi:hypothetical protein